MMQKEFVLEIDHRVYYSNSEPVPVADIAASLLALERIIKRTPRILMSITQVEIADMDVFVSNVASGSLIENVIVRLFFGSQEKMDQFLEKIHTKLMPEGENGVMPNRLFGAVVVLVVGYGIYSAAKAVGATEAAKAVNVNNNTIINIVVEESGVEATQLEGIVRAAVSDKKLNAKDAVDFIKPAKRDPKASITFDGSNELLIPNEVVTKAPSRLEIESDPSEKFYKDVDLHIRATNLDSSRSGWAALVPSIMGRRVKMELAEGIDLRQVAGRFSVRADVIVHSRPHGPKHEMKPVKITLVRLVDDN